MMRRCYTVTVASLPPRQSLEQSAVESHVTSLSSLTTWKRHSKTKFFF